MPRKTKVKEIEPEQEQEIEANEPEPETDVEVEGPQEETKPAIKPKRTLTEKQLENLKRAREAALLKKKELKELAQKAKALPQKEIEVKAAEYDKLEEKKKQILEAPKTIKRSTKKVTKTEAEEEEEEKKPVHNIKNYKKYFKAYIIFKKNDNIDLIDPEYLTLLHEYDFEHYNRIPQPKYKNPPIVFIILDDLIGDNKVFKHQSLINNITIKHWHLGVNLVFTSQNPRSIPNIIRNYIDVYVLYKYANVKWY
jgi:hypothetical protein